MAEPEPQEKYPLAKPAVTRTGPVEVVVSGDGTTVVVKTPGLIVKEK